MTAHDEDQSRENQEDVAEQESDEAGTCDMCGNDYEQLSGENGKGGLEVFLHCPACGYLPGGVR